MSLAPVEIEFTDLSEFKEPIIPCEVPSIVAADEWSCDYNPAEWIAYRSVLCPCGIIVRLVCTDCKGHYQRMMAMHAHIYCATCDTETKGFDRFEPLKQTS